MKLLTANCRLKKILKKYPSCIRHTCIATICLFLTGNVIAQTLFTYGKHAVSREEFLKAYNKNNSDSSAHISYEEYLELYSRFKIKVQSALDAGMDTSIDQKSELESFRYQLSENFLKDDESTRLLVDEAFERSQKDIHLSYILMRTPPGSDSAVIKDAEIKIDAAWQRLANGESFEKVAKAYEHGTVGYITVFVLPYEIENIAYAVPEGKFSKPFRAASGYYILKNNDERKAVGNVRVSQILLAFPPSATEVIKKRLEARADSIYKALSAGADFGEMAKRYSNDNLTYINGGEMPAFGVGQYDTAFTNVAFALEKDGEISRPVLTSFGYHILSRIQRIEVINDKSNAAWLDMLKEKVLLSDRMQAGRSILANNIKKIIEKDASESDLVNDSTIINYYRMHLENYNADYAEQLKEFKEGNLLFGIMQKKVWDAASADSAALRNFYNAHKEKYNWEISADALILTCIDPNTTDSVRANIKNNYRRWKQWAEQSNGMIQADSGRFELSQIPVAERTNFTEGLVTAPVTNEQDNSKTFAYIIRLHNEKEPKNFEDAKGMVINDYQVFLEEQWIADLKKKYPVKVNKKVLKSLPKNS